jgi:hypothetical protein
MASRLVRHTEQSCNYLIIFLIFVLVGGYSVFFNLHWNKFTIPIVIDFITLVISSYLTVKIFEPIIPNKRSVIHIVFGVGLFILFIGLALTLSNPALFTYLFGILFVVANMKYISMLGLVRYTKMLQYKIFFDLIGVFGAFTSYFVIVQGYPLFGEWFFCIGLVIGNCLAIKLIKSKKM